MLKNIFLTAVVLAVPFSSAQAQVLNNIPSIENDLNQGMGDELNDIILTLPDMGPDLECVCYNVCQVLAAIARGNFRTEAAQEAALAEAMIADKMGGMISAVRNGGKLDMELMGKATFKMSFAKNYDPKATAVLLERTGKAILR